MCVKYHHEPYRLSGPPSCATVRPAVVATKYWPQSKDALQRLKGFQRATAQSVSHADGTRVLAVVATKYQSLHAPATQTHTPHGVGKVPDARRSDKRPGNDTNQCPRLALYTYIAVLPFLRFNSAPLVY